MHDNSLKTLTYSSSKNLADELKNLIQTYKIVHLKYVPIDINLITFYTEIVDTIGEAVSVGEDNTTGDLTGERWTDVRYLKEKDYTFRHSNTRQPLHTDAAYTNQIFDVNFFFSLESAEVGGATVFIDGINIIDILQRFEPELFNDLISTDVIFQKGNETVKIKKPIELLNNGYELNWNNYRVSKDNSESVRKLCIDYNNFLENRIVSAGLLKPVYLKVGEGLFFQDSQVLHGRNSFYGNRYLIKGAFNLKK